MEGETIGMEYDGNVETYSTEHAHGVARGVANSYDSYYPSESYEISFTASISAEEIVDELEEDDSIEFLEQDTLFSVVK